MLLCANDFLFRVGLKIELEEKTHRRLFLSELAGQTAYERVKIPEIKRARKMLRRVKFIKG